MRARDAAKRLARHRAAPTAKDSLVQNINSAKIEKHWCTDFEMIFKLPEVWQPRKYTRKSMEVKEKNVTFSFVLTFIPKRCINFYSYLKCRLMHFSLHGLSAPPVTCHA